MPVLLNGAPGSRVARILAARHGAKDYTPNFQLRLLAKDLSYAIGEAGGHGIDLTTAKAALGTLNAAASAGLGDEDMAAVLRFVESRGA
jgi:3-hydroxyisobutyrate dehydrogenase-like beta-hydroxyacid dehydrogenase